MNEDHWQSLEYINKIKQQISYVKDRSALSAFDLYVWDCFIKQRKNRSDSDILENPEHHFRIKHLTDALAEAYEKHKEEQEEGTSRILFIRTPKGNGKT